MKIEKYRVVVYGVESKKVYEDSISDDYEFDSREEAKITITNHIHDRWFPEDAAYGIYIQELDIEYAEQELVQVICPYNRNDFKSLKPIIYASCRYDELPEEEDDEEYDWDENDEFLAVYWRSSSIV